MVEGGGHMKPKMSWKSILVKLNKGIALTDRETKASDIRMFNSKIEKIAYTSARSTNQFDGLGRSGGGIVEQLQSGSIFPDEMFGWSTKTILAMLVGLLVMKLKKTKGA